MAVIERWLLYTVEHGLGISGCNERWLLDRDGRMYGIES